MTSSDETVRIKLDISTTKIPSKSGSGYVIYTNNKSIINPNEKVLVPTGVFMAIPKEFYGQLHLLDKHIGTLKLLGGVIDSDYRGEVKAILFNDSQEPFVFERGDEVCKIIFVRINCEDIIQVENLDESLRGDGGFGSTGK